MTTPEFLFGEQSDSIMILVNESNVVWYTAASAGGFSTNSSFNKRFSIMEPFKIATVCESAFDYW
jgi:hypothetical protein